MATIIDSDPIGEPLTAYLRRLDDYDWLFDGPLLLEIDPLGCWLRR